MQFTITKILILVNILFVNSLAKCKNTDNTAQMMLFLHGEIKYPATIYIYLSSYHIKCYVSQI